RDLRPRYAVHDAGGGQRADQQKSDNARRHRHQSATPTMTSVDLMTTMTGLPGTSPSDSAECAVIAETIVSPPRKRTMTSAITSSLVTDSTTPESWLRALSFIGFCLVDVRDEIYRRRHRLSSRAELGMTRNRYGTARPPVGSGGRGSLSSRCA